MSHELAFTADGTARFAFNNRKAPWHTLGQPMEGYGTAEKMLQAAHSDFHVSLRRLIVTNDEGLPLKNSDGSYVYADDSRATVKEETDEKLETDYEVLATVGTRYAVTQYREVLERGLTLVEANGEAVIDTLGTLYGGRRFFAGVKLGEVELLKTEHWVDTLSPYLLITSSHDGKWPMGFDFTAVRPVCKNTVAAGQSASKARYRMRHTKNNAIDFDVDDARKVMGIAEAWIQGYRKVANALLSVNATQATFDAVFSDMFALEADATDRQKATNDELHTLVSGIWHADTNAGGFGMNGWTVYNAFSEYLDHYRDGDVEARALTSIDGGSWVSKKKQDVQARVLQFA